MSSESEMRKQDELKQGTNFRAEHLEVCGVDRLSESWRKGWLPAVWLFVERGVLKPFAHG